MVRRGIHSKKKHNRYGLEYSPVDLDDIVDAVISIGDEGKTAEEIGGILWPHLKGGPARGGPSRAAVAASFQLAKAERAGCNIRSEWNGSGPRRWYRKYRD